MKYEMMLGLLILAFLIYLCFKRNPVIKVQPFAAQKAGDKHEDDDSRWVSKVLLENKTDKRVLRDL